MVPWLAQNVPTPMNSIAVLLVLCVFLFGGMAFAISRQESGRAFNGASPSGEGTYNNCAKASLSVHVS